MRAMQRLLLASLFAAAACSAPAPSEPAPAPPPATAAPDLPATFPRSLKGYALYGWTRGGTTWFTLITGTNRLKTFDELDRPDPVVEDDGWVRVRVAGAERAADLVRRVPAEPGVLVETVRHVSVVQIGIPDDVGVPSEEVLAQLRSVR